MKRQLSQPNPPPRNQEKGSRSIERLPFDLGNAERKN
jgi:hypothetical protein